MFFLSKKKIILKDLIPNGFKDIHSHLLPGIDDGSPDIETSIRLISQMQEFGIEHFTATPHIFQHVWDNTSQIIQDTLAKSNPNFQTSLGIKANAAAEYMMDDHLVQLVKNRDILTLKDSYILIEMSYLAPSIHWEQILFDIQLAGYQPVLAHPERYTYWRTDFSEFRKFKDRGCLFQINALSPTGYYGWEVCESAERLLKENYIDCVGTDIHHQRHIDGFKQALQIKSIKEFEQAFDHPLNKL